MIVRHRFWHAALVAVACVIGETSLAQADWAACQSKPTRACILDEAMRGDSGPLAGKDRLDVLIQAGAILHPEYGTPADLAEASRLAQSTPNVGAVNYALLAIKGLVATNQKQQAIDLVGSLTGATQLLAIRELARGLAKADDVDTALTLTERLQPPLDRVEAIRNTIATEAAKALADDGKIEKALTVIADQRYATDYDMADMQAAIGQAYAKRGDAKTAREFFDRAQKNIDAARRFAVGARPDMSFRFATMRLLALRGDGEGLRAALQQVPPDTDPSASYERSNGYRRLLGVLLETKQLQPAIDVAKALATPAEKDGAIAGITSRQASDGQLKEARATFALLTDPGETPARLVALRAIAGGSAKAGDVTAALEIVTQISQPLARRATLFAIARVMPQ